MSLTIRPLVAADEPVWRTLWAGYLDFYGTEVEEAVYRTTFLRLLAHDPGEFMGRLAVVDGVAAGLVHYLVHRHCWRTEDVVYLQDLFVAPKARGHGVGRALIEQVYAEAREAGAGAVWWLTQSDNRTARALYDQVADVTPFVQYRRSLA